MAERVLEEYSNSVSLNGAELSVVSQRVHWSGDRTETPGYWMQTRISLEGREVYNEGREITYEFRGYVKQKHNQIVRKVRRCTSLEDIPDKIDLLLKR